MVNISVPFYLSPDPNNTNLPICPSEQGYPDLINYISFPSVVFISFALSLVSLVFGFVTAIFYNSVPVYEKKEHLGVVSTNERLGMLSKKQFKGKPKVNGRESREYMTKYISTKE
jgi:hypothetical protein